VVGLPASQVQLRLVEVELGFRAVDGRRVRLVLRVDGVLGRVQDAFRLRQGGLSGVHGVRVHDLVQASLLLVQLGLLLRQRLVEREVVHSREHLAGLYLVTDPDVQLLELRPLREAQVL
jgi:hypothetical protein